MPGHNGNPGISGPKGDQGVKGPAVSQTLGYVIFPHTRD
jgi:hypothetical protein